MLILKIGEVRVDDTFLIAPRLMTQVLIDVEFCVANKVTVRWPCEVFSVDINNEVTKLMFVQATGDLASSVTESLTTQTAAM